MVASGIWDVKSACKQLNIRYTTGRNIVSWYRQTGKIFRSKRDELIASNREARKNGGSRQLTVKFDEPGKLLIDSSEEEEQRREKGDVSEFSLNGSN